jgi:hypothetical protein
VSEAIQRRIKHLQEIVELFQREVASKVHADEFSTEWAINKNLEHTITPMQVIMRQLERYQKDVENEDIPWNLEKVTALAEEFFRQIKAAFDTEVERTCSRARLLVEALGLGDRNRPWGLFGIPYDVMGVQTRWIEAIFSVLLLDSGNDVDYEDNGSEDIGSDEEVTESEDSDSV